MMSGITRNTTAFVQTVMDIMYSVGCEKERVKKTRPLLTEAVEDYGGSLDACEKLIEEQRKVTNLLLQKLGLLERKLKQNVMADRRRQFNLVKNNVICRTKGTVGDIQKFVSNSIESGGGPKTTQKSISVVEISPPAGKTRDQKIFRVCLADDQKKNLFVGFVKAESDQNIRVDNECPAYLVPAKRQLERISFSLRKQFKETHNIRVKICYSGLRLRLKVKDTNNTTWMNLDDVKASDYSNSPVHFLPEEDLLQESLLSRTTTRKS